MVIWHTACLRKPYGANRLRTATEAFVVRYQAVLWAEATGTGTGCLGESWCRCYRVGYAMPVLQRVTQVPVTRVLPDRAGHSQGVAPRYQPNRSERNVHER